MSSFNMQRATIFLLSRFIIFYSLYLFKYGEALYGRNVRQALEGEFPSVVCIVRLSNFHNFFGNDIKCTGTLITHDHILTSAHCFENMGIHSIHALVGSIDLRQATRYHIYWWITYNLWAASQNRELEFDTNDIAIIKLLTQVNETIIPALVSFDDNSNLVGLDAVIAGWGKLADGLNPNILHTVNVRIISRDDCETIAYRVVQRYVYISERYLCTLAEPYALINSGDSGGPLIFGSFILGVNQGTCPRTGTIIDIRKANLHCGVDYYRMFINDLMRL